MSNRKISTVVVAAAVTCLVSVAQAEIRYVDDDAPLGGDGQSWSTPHTFLWDALVEAAGDPGITEIRIAQGTYQPDRRALDPDGSCTPGPCMRQRTFQLIEGLALRGGFLGLSAGKGEDPNERNVAIYNSILSGDLLGNDVPGADHTDPSRQDNAYHVVTGSGTTGSTLIDGFTITAGTTPGGGTVDILGGGMLNDAGSPTVIDCTFTGNFARFGGGMYNGNGSSPSLSSCQFIQNAAEEGGGMVNEVNSSPSLDDCLFNLNTAEDSGGGISNIFNSSPQLTQCLFTNNQSLGTNNAGGAIRNFDQCSPTLTGCDFFFNTAQGAGGAMQSQSSCNPTVTDCVFTGNSAGLWGGAVAQTFSDSPTYTRCTFQLNHADDDGGASVCGSDSMSFTDCEFDSNTAGGKGGGIMLDGCSPTIAHCTFTNNAAIEGGGLYAADGMARVVACEIRGNSADNGGGMYNANGGHALVVNSVFAGNTAMFFAGGGVYNEFSSNPKFVNCLFTGNTSAWRGAAMTNGQASAPQIIGCTFSLNIAAITCGGIYNLQSSAPVIVNTILWGNSDTDGATDTEGAQILNDNSTAAVDFSCIEGWTGSLGGLGNISDDPSFVDPDGTDDLPGTVDDDTRLQSGSPCIDSGHNWAVPSDSADLDGDADTTELTSLDLDGNPRFADDPATPDTGAGIPAVVDIGAYEFPGIRARCIFPHDVTGDGAVNVLDLIQLLLCFGQHAVAPSPCALADFNVDGSVNVLDLIDLLLAFGTACA